jgi:hypothetical protein
VATPVRESDDPIVARKGLTSLERRGSAVSEQASKPSLPPGLVPITETIRAMVVMCAEHAVAWEAYRRAGCGKSARPVRRGGVTGKASLCDSRPSLSTLLSLSEAGGSKSRFPLLKFNSLINGLENENLGVLA